MPFLAQVLSEMAEPEFRREYSHIYGDAYNIVKQTVAAGTRQGIFRRDLDVDAAAWLLVNSYLTVVSAKYVDAEMLEPDLPGRLIDTIMGPIKKQRNKTRGRL